jgi:hypothetical protein
MMDDLAPIFLSAMLAGLRLMFLSKQWKAPLATGKDWFFTVRVDPASQLGVRAALLRRYRAWMLAPFVADALVIPLLIATGRAAFIVGTQGALLLFTMIYYNLAFYHFAMRAADFALPDPDRPQGAQLVLEPRRLRDHTNWVVEAAIAAAMAGSIFLLRQRLQRPLFATRVTAMFWWMLYAQAGLALLKLVFVHWRIKLPLRRTDDFRRWRTAWLAFNLRILDAVRLLFASGLLVLAVSRTAEGTNAIGWILGVWVLALVPYSIYCIREGRRLEAVRREVEPVTLVREFPPAPVAEGNFYLHAMLYFNPDNPQSLVRSPRGLALNLASRATLLWIVYLGGLLALLAWQISR